MSSVDNYKKPYVEDYDSTLSEVVPLRPRKDRKKSGLAETSNAYDGVSDSGYSSHDTPNIPETPSTEASPPPLPRMSRRESRARSGSLHGRPTSKSFSRMSTPAVPRNIPNAKSRDNSPATTTTGGADECDCADCKTTKPSPLASSPSVLSGSWSSHNPSSSWRQSHSFYGHSPHWSGHGGGYQYPMRYEGYGQDQTDSGVSDISYDESKRYRTSMPPPSRPQSTFGASTSSSSTQPSSSHWAPFGSSAAGYGGSYFGAPSASPVPAPPTPASTCPPQYMTSMYAPPPVSASSGSPAPFSNSGYAAPPTPTYSGYSQDPWARTGTPTTQSSGYPTSDYSSMPPPTPPQREPSTRDRRSSMKSAQAASTALRDLRDPESPEYIHSSPKRRPSARVSGSERPPSWYRAPVEALDRSYSVPPEASIPEPRRRMTTTPGPAPSRRRESGHSQASSGLHSSRLGPSALSHMMENCAIADDGDYDGPRYRAHYDQALTRREPGTMARSSRSDEPESRALSRASRAEERERLSLRIPESEKESFTMRYPAGVPVKLQLPAMDGSHQRTISLGARETNGVELSIAYRYIEGADERQRQRQLQYGRGPGMGRRGSVSGA